MVKPCGFFGMMSSGKGVVSTAFLRWLKTHNDKKIISNCYLNDSNNTELSTEELYEKLISDVEYFRNSYLYITELHLLLESRSSNAQVNKNVTQMLTMIGKLDCTVIYDSQLVGQIDLRMREFTPYRFICERYKIKDNRIVPIEFFDGRIIKEQIAIRLWLQTTNMKNQDMVRELGFVFPTQEDYDYYKTRQIFTFDRSKFLVKK